MIESSYDIEIMKGFPEAISKTHVCDTCTSFFPRSKKSCDTTTCFIPPPIKMVQPIRPQQIDDQKQRET